MLAMGINPADFVHNHPYQTMIYVFVGTNLISTMPSPTADGTGFRGSTLYKWAFGFLHTINLPRLLVTLFPQFAGEVGILNQTETTKAVSAQAVAAAAKEVDKTVGQAIKAKDAVAEVKASEAPKNP
jgi:hypothetical protein